MATTETTAETRTEGSRRQVTWREWERRRKGARRHCRGFGTGGGLVSGLGCSLAVLLSRAVPPVPRVLSYSAARYPNVARLLHVVVWFEDEGVRNPVSGPVKASN